LSFEAEVEACPTTVCRRRVEVEVCPTSVFGWRVEAKAEVEAKGVRAKEVRAVVFLIKSLRFFFI